jgi:hypothetical protein
MALGSPFILRSQSSHLITPAQVGDFLWSPFGGVWSGTSSSQIPAWIGAPGAQGVPVFILFGIWESREPAKWGHQYQKGVFREAGV